MIIFSLRDLQFRRRRFVVTVVATSLVLALSLVLAGVDASFDNEVRRTVDAFDAGAWVLPEGVSGPFMSSATLDASLAAMIEQSSGVPAAALAVLRGSVRWEDEVADVNVHGVAPGSMAAPPIVDGVAPAGPGEAVVDRRLGAEVGDSLLFGERAFTVVGRTSGLTYRAGVTTVYLPLEDAQAIGYGGAPLATAIVLDAPVDSVPAGLVVLDRSDVVEDLLAPLDNPRKTITMVLGLLSLVAVMIVGSAVYLSSLDRSRDFAVFKAIGARDRSLFAGLATQSLLLCALAYAVAVVVSRALAPVVPMRPEVAGSSYVLLAVVAVAVAMVSSAVGVRRAVSVDPALAFGGA